MRQPQPHPDAFGPPAPRLDDLHVDALCERSTYEVETDDGWSLVVTRFRPLDQPFAQPIRGEPLLLVHGFCQNRHAWTCGGFVKHMLFYGADLHVLELRGHGLSSVALQRRRARRGRPLPADHDYAWDIDSYFLHDLPAAVDAVKARTGRETIFYCGHSMGGMLGYGYAGLRRDLAGLVTVGAPCDPGKGYLPLRLLAHLTRLEPAIDAVFAAAHGGGVAGWRARELLRAVARGLPLVRAGDGEPPPRRQRFRYYPFDALLRRAARALGDPRAYGLWARLARHHPLFANPSRLTLDEIRWLLREGGEREPRGVVRQFARWIRNGELRCYRSGYDFRAHYDQIDIPMAIIFGDRDPLASIASTKAIYREARSEYLLWRPVKGNSHLELTMGRDIRQICFDVKNLVEFARKFPPAREGEPARRDAVRAAARRESQLRVEPLDGPPLSA